MFFLVLLCSCGNQPSLGDKAEMEVNTVEGLYLEMLPNYTDRKAVVTVTNENYKRYCSDCSFDIQFLKDGSWYSVNSIRDNEREYSAVIFKREKSRKINCVWDPGLGQLPEGHYRLVMTLYEGKELEKGEPIYLSKEFTIGSEHYTESLYIKDDSPRLSLFCGEQTIIPYSAFSFSYDFKVFADGAPIEYNITEHKDEIPCCLYMQDMEIILNNNTEFRNIVVYSEELEGLGEYKSIEELSNLPSGSYYVGFETVSYHEYSEIENDFAYLGTTELIHMEKP